MYAGLEWRSCAVQLLLTLLLWDALLAVPTRHTALLSPRTSLVAA